MRKRNLARVNGISKLNRNRTKIFLMIFIAFIFLGNAYSALNQSLVVAGTTEIMNPGDNISIEDNIIQGNIDITIDEVDPGWWNPETLTHPNARFTFTVTNNNDFDVSNWYADITVPGLVANSIGSYIIQEINVINETIYISNAEGAYSHSSIKQGASRSYTISFATSTQDIAIEDFSAIAYTLIDTYQFKRYEYEYGYLKFIVDLNSMEITDDGKYNTSLSVDIINNSDETINSLGFVTNYNELTPIGSEENKIYLNIADTSNTLDVATDGFSSLSTTWIGQKDWTSMIQPNETIHCTISNLVTNSKLRPITISDVWYKTNTSTTGNSIVENTSTVTADDLEIGDVNVSTEEKQEWIDGVLTDVTNYYITCQITNPTESKIDFDSIYLYYGDTFGDDINLNNVNPLVDNNWGSYEKNDTYTKITPNYGQYSLEAGQSMTVSLSLYNVVNDYDINPVITINNPLSNRARQSVKKIKQVSTNTIKDDDTSSTLNLNKKLDVGSVQINTTDTTTWINGSEQSAKNYTIECSVTNSTNSSIEFKSYKLDLGDTLKSDININELALLVDNNWQNYERDGSCITAVPYYGNYSLGPNESANLKLNIYNVVNDYSFTPTVTIGY